MSQKVMERISEIQEKLSKGEIKINAPCGNEPLIELLGGLHARAAINETNKGKFPSVEEELILLEKLISLQGV